ncbi:MAG: M23 family metallopeptidase [Clostridiales bacterium]|nr:M23 family metallopeptidase [Clostridiales bacterium]
MKKLERYRPYNSRRSAAHRRRSASAYKNDDKTSRHAIKLFICAGLFVVAAVTKLLFPAEFKALGDKINTVVNYRAALTALGQGINGEKKFTTALGEAFTYAFTGKPDNAAEEDEPAQGSVDITPDKAENIKSEAEHDPAAAANEGEEEVKAVFSETDTETITDGQAGVSSNAEENTFSSAVIAAFLKSQDEYSDYSIPAGVTYEMPRIGIAYANPVAGEVSSSFGYRNHPVDKTVKFHYGTDIAAKKGTPITAFADGKVLTSGENSSFGKYVVLYHGDIETQYAHCDNISVTDGQAVKKGDKIATVGCTGNATQACLHFEMKVNGQYVNPEYYVQWK